ncbi:MAG: ABC transporter permease, partial [Bryobacteraceae bacterium]|nr:ABC transporter permease [Bryobacteraceae bacterium]
ALVVAEIALSLVLAIGAGLLFRTMTALADVDLGFQPDQLVVMNTSVAAQGDTAARKAAYFYRDLLPQLRTVPGVEAAAGIMGLPAGKKGSNGSYIVEGRAAAGSQSQQPYAGFNVTTPQYFLAMETPMLRGRDFEDRDTYDSPGVAIVNRSFVLREFPKGDAIGKRIRCGLDRDIWMTIVGVVGDVRHDNPARDPGPQIYMPYLQHPWHSDELDVVIRASTDANSVVLAARKIASSVNPDVSLSFSTMHAILATSVSTPRFRSVLMLTFAGLAALLAMAGVYGVMAYAVSQRVSEMGLRLALGASRGDLIRLVLHQSLRIAAVGLLLGVGLAMVSSRLLQSMLYKVEPLDITTYALAAFVIACMAILAALLPSLRAAGVDPVQALRAE